MYRARPLSRRDYVLSVAAGLATPLTRIGRASPRTEATPFSLRYVLASCMYGYAELSTILPEVTKTGATSIDIWPKVHGNQREQLSELGEAAFLRLLQQHQVSLACLTQYPLGPFGLQDEMRVAKRLRCPLIVTGGRGPTGLRGTALKTAVARFVEQMKPHLERAEQAGVTIAIENHANNLIDGPDSMKWLAELRPSSRLAIAFAPYHLPQNERLLAALIRQLGESIVVFYAWQHGMGCTKKLPKHQELLQMPGRGALDFVPLLEALRDINYNGLTEIFMHPVPRGVPIRDTPEQVTAEINRARDYLQRCLRPA